MAALSLQFPHFLYVHVCCATISPHRPRGANPLPLPRVLREDAFFTEGFEGSFVEGNGGVLGAAKGGHPSRHGARPASRGGVDLPGAGERT